MCLVFGPLTWLNRWRACYRDSLLMNSGWWYHIWVMTLWSRTLLLPRHGGRVVCYPVMSLLSADGGRKSCFGPCGNVWWIWSSSAGILIAGRSGNFDTISRVCQEQVATALDRHMMNVHLELEQLWRCPVEWCTVWKGSLSDCLSHLHEKHGGSQYVAMNNLVHTYWVYCDPFPHLALRGRVMNKFVCPGPWPLQNWRNSTSRYQGLDRGGGGERCRRSVSLLFRFPGCRCYPAGFLSPARLPSWVLPRNRIGCQIRYPWTCRIFYCNLKLDFPLLLAPPCFECFVCPEATGGPGGNPSMFDFSSELPGRFPLGLPVSSGDQPSLPISPILSDSPALLKSPPVNLSCPTLTLPTVASTGIPHCPANRDLRALFHVGGFPGRALFSLNDHLCLWTVLGMAVLSIIPHIALWTTLGRLDSLVLRCIIPGS